MVTMDMLEQDNYYDATPTTTLSIPSSPSGVLSTLILSSYSSIPGSGYVGVDFWGGITHGD